MVWPCDEWSMQIVAKDSQIGWLFKMIFVVFEFRCQLGKFRAIGPLDSVDAAQLKLRQLNSGRSDFSRPKSIAGFLSLHILSVPNCVLLGYFRRGDAIFVFILVVEYLNN